MPEDKNNADIPFIACPECRGSGVDSKGNTCRKCGGTGEGVFFEGQFLYWGEIVNRTTIFLRRLKQALNFILDIFFFLVFLGGFSALVYWIWQGWGGNGELPKELLFFWENKNPFVLWFWISCFSLMFFVYRADRRAADEVRIKKFVASKDKGIPDNWEGLKRFSRRLDIAAFYREKTLLVIEDAYKLALKLKSPEVTVMHLFSSMLKSVKVAVLFTRLDVSGRDLVEKLNKQLALLPRSLKKEADLRFSPEVKEILIEGFIEAYRLGQDNANVLNLILSCLEKDDTIREILLDLKVDEGKIKNTVAWFRINDAQVENYRLYKRQASFKPSTTMDRAYTAMATPLLNSLGYDLTLAAKWGRLGLCVAREKEIAAVFEAMKSGAYGVILTGLGGVGKKTIVEGIAREMVTEERVPDFLKDKRLIELDVARLISGADPAAAQERLLTIIDEVRRAGNIILFIENLENIVGISAGEKESLELSEVLSGELQRGSLRCLATATETNYIKYIQTAAIGNVLSRLKIEEPKTDQAIQILESKVGFLEAQHDVFFSYNAIESAVTLSAKMIHDKYLPASAIEIAEKTAVRVAGEQKGKKYICGRNDIAVTINLLTDIPVQDIEAGESEKLLHLEEEIHKYMVDQEEAVDMVADALRRARTSLRSEKRPIANFLFLGPTGVGKTELAKTIARVYFKKKDLMVRLDMSEYQHEDSVVKMIGEPDGAAGYLTEAVRQKPFCLVLLDEFEKAHPKIFNLFLQVMDDGRLTDGQGRTIDFTDTIIIATSNAGSDYVQQAVGSGEGLDKIREVLINEHLSKVMRPELINRFDGVIVFKPLSEKDTADIARLMLKDVSEMLAEKGIGLEISEEGLKSLAAQGFDPKFGARPLRRLIQDKVENEIAKKLLGSTLERRDTIMINSQGEIEVRKRKEL